MFPVIRFVPYLAASAQRSPACPSVPQPLRHSHLLAVLLLGALCPHPAGAQSLDADPRTRPIGVPESWKQLAAWFLPGFELAAPVVDRELDELDEQRLVLQAVTGVCYGAAAFSDDILDLDVRLYLDGRLVEQDIRPDAYPVATYCADDDGELTAVVRADVGAGAARLALFVQVNSDEAAGGPRDELSNRLDAAIRAGAARWTLRGEQWRRSFDAPGIAVLDTHLDAGRCHAFVAVGQAGVADLDLRLRDRDGAELARDLLLDATPIVVYCADNATDVELDVAVTIGSGTVALQHLTRPAP